MADTVHALIRDYLRAAAYLYGRICLSSLYHIFTLHNGDLLSADAFYRLAREAEAPDESFRIIGDDDVYRADISVPDMDRWLVHRQFCYATWDELFTLENNQEGKTIRIFSKEEMLSYSDPAFIPDTPPILALKELLDQHSDGQLPVSQILSQALMLARDDCDAPGFLKEMQRLGCHFGSMEDRLQAARCYKAVYDTVPKPIHSGNSELEWKALPDAEKPAERFYLWFCGSREDDGFHLNPEQLTGVLPYTGITEHQRFLNRCMQEQELPTRLFDPCHCGSGLSYTDCCGKR